VEFAFVPVLPLCSEPWRDLHSLASHDGVRIEFSADELKANVVMKGSALLSSLELDAAAISSASFMNSVQLRCVSRRGVMLDSGSAVPLNRLSAGKLGAAV
jgi:hypothetical protein